MSGQIQTKNLNEAVELTEQEAGVSTRSVVPIPDSVADDWNLKYGEYVRVTVDDGEDGPVLAIAPMGDLAYRHRTNDLKLSGSSSVALPRRLVRSFNISGDVWWEEFGNQLVGSLMSYSDSQTLYEVTSHYTDATPPVDDSSSRRTTFHQLRDIADREYSYSEQRPGAITTHRGSVRHYIPDGLGLDEGDRGIFVVFHDGDGFLLGLLPSPASITSDDQSDDEVISTITIKETYLPDGGTIAVRDADGNRLGHTEQLDSGTHTDVELPLYEDIEESTRVLLTAKHNGTEYEFKNETVATTIALEIDGETPEVKTEEFEGIKSETAEDYSMKYNPLSASPYEGYEEEKKLPDIILDYDKDSMAIHRDRDGDLYYTVPKQVASCLWLDDGYMTDWLKLGDMYLSRLTPEQSYNRADPQSIPSE